MNQQPISIPAKPNTITVSVAGQRIVVADLPGLPGWEEVSPAVQLIASNVELSSAGRVLLFGCHRGELASYLLTHMADGYLAVIEQNTTALQAASLTISANSMPLTSARFLDEVDLPGDFYSSFNTVIINLPKGRQLARRWLLQAFNALLPGGKLYLAGSNNAGIQSIIKDAEDIFSEGVIRGYKKGNRLAVFMRSAGRDTLPDWAFLPGISPQSWVEFAIELKGQQYCIRSLPGIFSYDHLDEGTRMLLDNVEIPNGAKVLDVGCGYGVIGLFAAVNGARLVRMVDNNLLAVAACRETVHFNHISNVEINAWDVLNQSIDGKYDLVISNPPFHSSHAVDYQVTRAIIRRSFDALDKNGRLVIVANRFIRYDRLINEIFGNVSITAESGKFHVLLGLKSA